MSLCNDETDNKHLEERKAKVLEWERLSSERVRTFNEMLEKDVEKFPVKISLKLDALKERLAVRSVKRNRTGKLFPMRKVSKKLPGISLVKRNKKKKKKGPNDCTLRDIWAPPREGYYDVCADGSMRKKSGGYGAIVRDHHGKPIAVAAGVSKRVSKLYHQLQGVEKGLLLAKSCGCRKVYTWVNSIYTAMVAKGVQLPYREDRNKELTAVINHISCLTEEFVVCMFYFSNRQCNKAADYISKLHKEIEFKDEKDLPDELIKILEEDNASWRKKK